MVTNLVQANDENSELQYLHDVFDKQKKAFKDSPMASAKERIENLAKLHKAMVKHKDALTQAMSDDFGNRPHDASTLNDIMICLESIKYQSKRIKE